MIVHQLCFISSAKMQKSGFWQDFVGEITSLFVALQ